MQQAVNIPIGEINGECAASNLLNTCIKRHIPMQPANLHLEITAKNVHTNACYKNMAA